MNVNSTKTGDLTATLTVAIEEADYSEKVEKQLKDYRKRANIPGFRPGHVPAGLVKKQYGKAILIDEVNHILQHAIYDFIQKEKLDILGNPVPVEQTDIDWDNSKSFSFDFEIGLSPEVDVEINDKLKVPYTKIEADAEMIERYVEDYAKRYGKMSSPEKVEEHALIKGEMSESGDSEEPISNTVTISIDSLKDAKKVMGKKVGDKVELAVSDFNENFNLANLLGVSKSELEQSSGKFTLAITEVSKLEPAELNQELFDKVFGEGKVSSEEEFRQMIKEEAESVFVGESDRKFYEDVKKAALEKAKFELPEEFLKKWLRTSGEKPMSEAEVEEQFPQMVDDMRWQLIENKVIKEQNIEISQEDMVAYTLELLQRQMAQYGQQLDAGQLTEYANRVLQNKEEAQRIAEQLMSQKLLNHYRSTVKLQEEKKSFGDFMKMLSENR